MMLPAATPKASSAAAAPRSQIVVRARIVPGVHLEGHYRAERR
jgi:hypothetical protein